MLLELILLNFNPKLANLSNSNLVPFGENYGKYLSIKPIIQGKVKIDNINYI